MSDENALEPDNETPAGPKASHGVKLQDLRDACAKEPKSNEELEGIAQEAMEKVSQSSAAKLSEAMSKMTPSLPKFEMSAAWKDVTKKIADMGRVGAAIPKIEMPGAALARSLSDKMPNVSSLMAGTVTGMMRKTTEDRDAYESDLMASIVQARAAEFEREAQDRATQQEILGQLIQVADHAREDKELAERAYSEEREESTRQRLENAHERAKADKYNRKMYLINLVGVIAAILIGVIGVAIGVRSLQIAEDALKASAAPQSPVVAPALHTSSSANPR